MSTPVKRRYYGLPIRLRMSDQTHRNVRIIAAKYGKTKADVIVQLVEIALRDHESLLSTEDPARKHSEAPAAAVTAPGTRDG